MIRYAPYIAILMNGGAINATMRTTTITFPNGGVKEFEVIETPAPHVLVDTKPKLHGWSYYNYQDAGKRECTHERFPLNPYGSCENLCFFCYARCLGMYARFYDRCGIMTVYRDYPALIKARIDKLHAACCFYLCIPDDEMMMIKVDGKILVDSVSNVLSKAGIDIPNHVKSPLKIPITRDLQVMSLEKTSGKINFNRINNIIFNPNVSKSVFRFKTRNGYFSTSPDHPVIVLKNEGMIEIPASKVEIGDHVLSPRKINLVNDCSTIDAIDYLDSGFILTNDPLLEEILKINLKKKHLHRSTIRRRVKTGMVSISEAKKIERILGKTLENSIIKIRTKRYNRDIILDDEFGFYLGLYISEGYATPSCINFSFHEKETDFIDFVRKFAIKNNDNTSFVTSNTKGVHIVHISKFFRDIVKNSCGKWAINKRLPDFTWNANTDFKISILKGCFYGDGSINLDSKNSMEISYTTVSRVLASQLKYLLQSFEINCTLVKWERPLTHTHRYVLRITGFDAKNISKLIAFRTETMERYENNTSIHKATKFEKIPSWFVDTEKLKNVEREKRHRIQRDSRFYGNIRKDLVNDVIKDDLANFNQNIVIDEIQDIKQEKYDGIWIDFEVDSAHTFLQGTSVFTHNCTATDAWQTIETRYHYSEEVIKMLVGLNLPVEFITKRGSLVPESVFESMATQTHSFVQFTIITPRSDLLKLLAPKADSFEQQIDAIKAARECGVRHVVARFDPIIPYLTDDRDAIEAMFDAVKAAGATHVISSCMDIPGSIKNKIMERAHDLFLHEGIDDAFRAFTSVYANDQSVGRDLNATMDYRRSLFGDMRKMASKRDLTFSLCMEFEVIHEGDAIRYRGLNEDFATSRACEGIDTPIYCRESLDEPFQPLTSKIPACDGNCLASAKGKEWSCKGTCGCEPFAKATSLEEKHYKQLHGIIG